MPRGKVFDPTQEGRVFVSQDGDWYAVDCGPGAAIPPQPITLTAVSTGPNTITVTWTEPPLGEGYVVAEYEVYYNTTGTLMDEATGFLIAIVPFVAPLSYSTFIHDHRNDPDIQPGTRVYYGVRSVDRQTGFKSEFSNTTADKPLAPPPPVIPYVEPTGPTENTVYWTEPVITSTEVSDYEVYYNTTGALVDETTGALIGRVPFSVSNNITSLIHDHTADTAIVPGSNVYYGLRSRSLPTGLYSTWVRVMETRPYLPPPPVSPSAVSSSPTANTVSWTEPVLGPAVLSDYEVWYNLTGAPVDTTTGTLLGSTPFGTEGWVASRVHDHTGNPAIVPGVTVYYGIRSKNAQVGLYSVFVQTAATKSLPPPPPVSPTAAFTSQFENLVTWTEPVLAGATLTGYEIWYNLVGPTVDSLNGTLAGTTPFGAENTATTFLHNHASDPALVPGTQVYYGIRSRDTNTQLFSAFVQTTMPKPVEVLASIVHVSQPDAADYLVQTLGTYGNPWPNVVLEETRRDCFGNQTITATTYTTDANGEILIQGDYGDLVAPYLAWVTVVSDPTVFSTQLVRPSKGFAALPHTATDFTTHQWDPPSQAPMCMDIGAVPGDTTWQYKSVGTDTTVYSAPQSHLTTGLPALDPAWTGTPCIMWLGIFPFDAIWNLYTMDTPPVIGLPMPPPNGPQSFTGASNNMQYIDFTAIPVSDYVCIVSGLWVIDEWLTGTPADFTASNYRGYRGVVKV